MKKNNEHVNKIINNLLVNLLNKIKNYDINSEFSSIFPGLNINNFIIKKIKKMFRFKKKITLGSILGDINIYYQNGILIEPIGLARIAVKNVVITEKKILLTITNIFDQIRKKYFSNQDYVIKKVNIILTKLSQKEIYNPGNSKEKSLLDLVSLILLNYYNISGDDSPDWLKNVIDNIDKKDIAQDFIDFFIENITNALEKISKNVYFDYKVTLDSGLLRWILNKKTNKGQISKLLSIFNFDLTKIIKNTANNYVSESFLNGFGELLIDMTGILVFDVNNQNCYKKVNPFDLTLTFGKDTRSSRVFRWFSNNSVEINKFNHSKEEFLEISDNKNFIFAKRIQSKVEIVNLARPTINFGVIAKYNIEKKYKYSAVVEGLEQKKTYYYRIFSKNRQYKNNFNTCDSNENFRFLAFADSQGMIKSDYDTFLKLFQSGINKFPDAEFVVHVGDFVDDGNNENYWDFLLDSPLWGMKPVVPVVGNHEAKFNPSLSFAGVKNSVFNHFAIDPADSNIIDNPENELYYAFEYKKNLFIVLDTNVSDDEIGLGRKQYNWIHNIVKKSQNFNFNHKIILTHKSAYSCGHHCNDTDVYWISRDIIKISAICGIDLVIGGHDHVYSRSYISCMNKNLEFTTHKNGENHEIISSSFDGVYSEGTVFVTLGTSGTKYYATSTHAPYENKKIMNFGSPSFAEINIQEQSIKFSIYKFDDNLDKLVLSDKFIISKNNYLCKFDNKINLIDASSFVDSIKKLAENIIANLPDCPWIDWTLKLQRVNYFLDHVLTKVFDKKELKNYKLFLKKCKDNTTYINIIKSHICIIYNKQDFLQAIQDIKIGTIIVKCDEIKFENRFGIGRTIFVNHNIIIKGKSEFLFVSFHVDSGITLIIDGEIKISNNRKIFSVYSAITAFKLFSDSTLILGEFVSISHIFGVGKSKDFKFLGENIKIYRK
ncbi:MAG: metallophosphoesterase [Candidatus Improbicoccus devescovinae]|nr:MAG: metallophosphoesterase [Candidatus Improbicoccus devescovinae]